MWLSLRRLPFAACFVVLVSSPTFINAQQQPPDDCPLFDCCEFECCGPGTSWDGMKCAYDMISDGWNGFEPPPLAMDVCSTRTCCEDGCCDDDARVEYLIGACRGASNEDDPATEVPVVTIAPTVPMLCYYTLRVEKVVYRGMDIGGSWEWFLSVFKQGFDQNEISEKPPNSPRFGLGEDHYPKTLVIGGTVACGDTGKLPG